MPSAPPELQGPSGRSAPRLTAERGESREGSGASPFLVALTESAVALEELPGGPARTRSVARVARFLQGQLDSLPSPLRWMMAAGLLGFRGLVWLRHPRGFTRLPRERRQQVFDLWAYGRLAPARQLMRPIRSIALFAWYENPEVQAALADRANPSMTSAAAETGREAPPPGPLAEGVDG